LPGSVNGKNLFARPILHTYDVTERWISVFVQIQGISNAKRQYPVRREFQAYKIMLLNGIVTAKDIFVALGFQVIEMAGYWHRNSGQWTEWTGKLNCNCRFKQFNN